MTIVTELSQSLVSADVRVVGELCELIADRLYFASVQGPITSHSPNATPFTYPEGHYEPFYHDFGPYNLSVLYRFCVKLNAKMKSAAKRKPIVFCAASDPHTRVNSAFLIGAYCIIYKHCTAEEAWQRLKCAQPPKYIPFRDAAMGGSTWDLTLADTLTAVQTACRHNWLDFSDFNPHEYEHYERVENGDFNWLLPDKFLAFCGPHQHSVVENGYPYHAPDVYFDYFRSHNVTTIVRLNKKIYDAKKFVRAGFEHVDLFFVDGSTPSDAIVERFIEVTDRTKGALAVHCKAGLGRTGTLIGCWMMKAYGITATECIAWMRICRPGCVIGPQQQFLIEKQSMCWQLGGWQRNGVRSTVKTATKHVKLLTNKVDDIKLNGEDRRQLQNAERLTLGLRTTSHRRLPRAHTATLVPTSRPPLPARHRSKSPTAHDILNNNVRGAYRDPGQGDRLLMAKLRQQHFGQHLCPSAGSSSSGASTVFTSPTTPVKPIRSSVSKSTLLPPPLRSAHAHRQISFPEAPTAKIPRTTLKQQSGVSRLPQMIIKPNNSRASNGVIARSVSTMMTRQKNSSATIDMHKSSPKPSLRTHPYSTQSTLSVKGTTVTPAYKQSPLLTRTTSRAYGLRPRVSQSHLIAATSSSSPSPMIASQRRMQKYSSMRQNSQDTLVQAMTFRTIMSSSIQLTSPEAYVISHV